MRLNLLGLDLESAQTLLAGEGVCPQIVVTNAPKRVGETRGVLRVVNASQDGSLLTVARFLDPLCDLDVSSDRNARGIGE